MAKAAAWALQNPKDAKARSRSQISLMIGSSYPRSVAAGKNQSQTSCDPALSPSARRFSSALARDTPVIVAMIWMTCS